MTFEEILDQAIAMLQRRGRLTYGALKRRFQLDDAYLDDVKAELIEGQRVAVDEGESTGMDRSSATSPAVSAPSPAPAWTPAPLGLAGGDQASPIAYTPRHLAERILAEQAALEARGAPTAKTITALFADIKGSMDLLEDLDQEARQIIDPALTLMMEAVHRYEGYVAQSLGDGIFALFGAPIAHEDHAQRALYAALRMQESIKRYADRLRLEHGVPLQIRVGEHRRGGGALVRTDDLHTDYVPIGHATSLAARMQSLAHPGSIVVSEATFRLTDGYFACHALGAAQIKGVSEPVPVYEVRGVGPLRTRFHMASRRGLARFVGRQRELELMQQPGSRRSAGRARSSSPWASQASANRACATSLNCSASARPGAGDVLGVARQGVSVSAAH